ncbi:MAG: excinuclease ABC subunit UvrA, partial [Oscillospiraceae bacterium]|nr:excinuclease ABC subunit UvrA [Oscillospiraceae bacterium]
MQKKIIIKGAREHNLKNIDLELPRDKLIVMTGLSGSGKSSLAFDTIYADGQRRYIESLSSYARQFLGQMEKPNVDSIEGLSPAISIDQKTTSKNPRSTVGTVTEIYDYLRLAYARIGIPHCPVCNSEIRKQTIDQIADTVMALPEKTKIQVMAPIVRGRKGEYRKELEELRKQGYVRVRIDGEVHDLDEPPKLAKTKKHDIEVVIDRLVIKEDIRSRLTDSLEIAAKLGENTIMIDTGSSGGVVPYSLNYACPEHGTVIEELTPRMFSFNNPYGACSKCTGLGVFMRVDPELLIPNKDLSIRDGAIKAIGWNYTEGTICEMYIDGLAKHYGFDVDAPISMLPDEIIDILLYGTRGEKVKLKRVHSRGATYYDSDFEGFVNNLERRYRDTTSNYSRDEISRYMSEVPCPECDGRRLNREALSVTVGGIDIQQFCNKSVADALDFVRGLKLARERDRVIAEPIVKEIKERLGFLKSVGLEYLSLSRSAGTLSGGESQRIRLATQIGSSLMGVLYILDEPSIGLHQRDNDKLIATLKRLRDLGNTLIVVEHDEETIHNADYIVDIGPGAGVHGGTIVCAGTLADIKKCKGSVTGQYLSGKKAIPVPGQRRAIDKSRILTITGARENNLKNIDVRIPLGVFTCVTGVSGSGKSSLINEILYKHLANRLNRARTRPGAFGKILGTEHLDKVIDIDQSPIGRTPRSNPATYTGVFTD